MIKNPTPEGQRIDMIMKAYGIKSRNQFANRIKLNQPRALTHIRSGYTGIPKSVLKLIIDEFPEVSCEWLLFGKGEMLKCNVRDCPLNSMAKE